MNLTYPEVVMPYNIERLQKLVNNKRDIYPGANYVYKVNSLISSIPRPINLAYRKSTEILELKYGDIVERHLQNGDMVLLNRQPTLHKQSVMGHIVKIYDNLKTLGTFRLPVYVTGPYNADFDGDEMNIFVPQSIQTLLELVYIANVKYQVISPTKSEACMGAKMDGIYGLYNLTKNETILDKSTAMNLLASININVDLLKRVIGDRISGRDIFSYIIPEKVNLKSNLTIVNGKITSGVVNKSYSGASKYSLVGLINDEYGPDEAKKFMDNMQKLVDRFNLYYAFTIGIGDITYNKEMSTNVNKIINTAILRVENIITENENYHIDDNKMYENKMNDILDNVMPDAGKFIADKLDKHNNFSIMMASGASKIDATRIGQIFGCVGQISVEGFRPHKKINNRSLVYFHQNDDSPQARGFISNSFYSGLRWEEFVFHLTSARAGLIDMALKTSDSGYVQRKLIKLMEDIVVNYDGTIRTANGDIVQYIYGDSGVDTIKQTKQKIDFILMTNEELSEKFKFKDNNYKNFDNKQYFNKILKYRNRLRYIAIKCKLDFKVLPSEFMLPINLSRLVLNYMNKVIENEHTRHVLEPEYVIQGIKRVLKKPIILCMSKKERENPNSLKNKDEKIVKTMFKYALHNYLSPKRCIIEYKFSREIFDQLIDEIIFRTEKSMIEPGELVGVIAAQSIGEPSTQLSVASWVHLKIIGNKNKNESISKFVDKLLEKNKKDVIELGNNSVVLNLKKDYYIIGVSNNEKTSWKRISQVSRHPANGGMIKVTTRSGKTTTCTLSHSFLKRTLDSIVPVKGSELKLGDRIPITKFIPEFEDTINSVQIGEKEVDLDKEFGWFLGSYLADGSLNNGRITITKVLDICIKNTQNTATNFGKASTIRDKSSKGNFKSIYGEKYADKVYKGTDTYFNCKELAQFIDENFSHGSFNKYVGAFVYASNLDFISGLLSGYFDGDGSVNAKKHLIKVHSRSEQLIDDVCILLAYFGIFACKLLEHSSYDMTKEMHLLSIPKKYAQLFKEKIGFQVKEKADELDKIIEWNNRDDVHDVKDDIDMIPELGNLIAELGVNLKLSSKNNPTYRRHRQKEAIGRRTLEKYINDFEVQYQKLGLDDQEIIDKINILKQGARSDVIWDRIDKIEYLDDPNELVYDFTVPGNDSFMVDAGILVHNTLNAFHYSGIAAKGTKTLGVPRINELLSNSKHIKTPKMTIYLEKEYMKDESIVNRILSYIKYTSLEHLKKKVEIFYDPDIGNSEIMKKDNVNKVFYSFSGSNKACNQI